MANYKAITAVGQAVADILTAAWQNEPLDRNISGVTFPLVQAADFAGGDKKIPGTGATVYLYRVDRNASCRSQVPRKDDKGKSYYPSLPLDLYFLITPWAPSADTQLYLLGWIMRKLEDIHQIPATSLNKNNEGTFGQQENVGLIFDPLSLADMATLWENLKTEKILPSVTYVVRGVLIDSDIEFSDAKQVQARDMKDGR
jgi:hypothetical protein